MVRAGIGSWIDDDLLRGLSPGVEVVRYDIDSKDPLQVDFLLAPWTGAQAAQVFPRLQGTKVVQSVSAGIEALLPLMPAGAVLCNAQNVHNVSTAEWAVTAILASLKFLPLYAQLQQAGTWITPAQAAENYHGIYPQAPDAGISVLIEELYAKTVLIVGYGAIGKAIEERLTAFGANILRVARSAREGVSPVSELPALLPQADIVVLITPLTPETYRLIDAAALAKMRQGALLVNAARGAVVDTDALVAALEAGKIRAALDVTDPEPLPAGHPLWRAPHLLLTPHVAGSSPIFLKRVLDFAAIQLGRFVRGEPLENVIEGHY